MTKNEILTGAEMIAYCLADSADAPVSELAATIARTAEVLVPLAVNFDPSIGNHGFFDIYRIGYSDAEILIAAGLVASPAYTNNRKLTQAGAALFARRA